MNFSTIIDNLNNDKYGQDTLKAERQRYLDRILNEINRERTNSFSIPTTTGSLTISTDAHNAIVRGIQKECYTKAAELVMDTGIPKTGRELEALCKKLTDLADIAPREFKL